MEAFPYPMRLPKPDPLPQNLSASITSFPTTSKTSALPLPFIHVSVLLILLYLRLSSDALFPHPRTTTLPAAERPPAKPPPLQRVYYLGIVKLPPNFSVPAVFVFGDSIMDTGNNNNMTTPSKCNFPPYGKDFPGRIPTGRFGNGKVPSDLIVEELGIKEFLPAYLDPNLQPSELPTGVNFASGGAGYDPVTSKLETAISMSGQLDLFKDYIGKLKRLVGDVRTNFILANSIVVVVLGSNDISNTYFLSHLRQSQYDFPTYADLLVNSASNFYKDLYQLGARRIAVFNAPPVGCVPFQRTMAGGITRKCVQQYNDAAVLFNNKLAKEIDSFNQKFPNSRVVSMDVYTPLLDIIVNSQKYGYQVGDRGCCGTGMIEVTYLCNHLEPTCPNDSEYVFWDSFHPTEATYRKLVGPVLQKYMHLFL